MGEEELASLGVFSTPPPLKMILLSRKLKLGSKEGMLGLTSAASGHILGQWDQVLG
jgi:hypothetical protein